MNTTWNTQNFQSGNAMPHCTELLDYHEGSVLSAGDRLHIAAPSGTISAVSRKDLARPIPWNLKHLPATPLREEKLSVCVSFVLEL